MREIIIIEIDKFDRYTDSLDKHMLLVNDVFDTVFKEENVGKRFAFPESQYFGSDWTRVIFALECYEVKTNSGIIVANNYDLSEIPGYVTFDLALQ